MEKDGRADGKGGRYGSAGWWKIAIFVRPSGEEKSKRIVRKLEKGEKWTWASEKNCRNKIKILGEIEKIIFDGCWLGVMMMIIKFTDIVYSFIKYSSITITNILLFPLIFFRIIFSLL